jgi:hypothetical protein
LDAAARRKVREIIFDFSVNTLPIAGEQSGKFGIEAIFAVGLTDEV